MSVSIVYIPKESMTASQRRWLKEEERNLGFNDIFEMLSFINMAMISIPMISKLSLETAIWNPDKYCDFGKYKLIPLTSTWAIGMYPDATHELTVTLRVMRLELETTMVLDIHQFIIYV